MIPKIIHQIWLGDAAMPERMMASWRANHPGWEYRLWTDADLPPLANAAQFEAMEQIAGKADILRYEILHRLGGVYVDADMTSLRPLGDELLEDEFFAAYEHEEALPGVIGQAAMGSVAGHPVLEEMIARIGLLDPDELRSVDPTWTTGPYAFTPVVEDYWDEVRIHPSDLFYPDHWAGSRAAAQDAYARHDYYSRHPTVCLVGVVQFPSASVASVLRSAAPHVTHHVVALAGRGRACEPEVRSALRNVPGAILGLAGAGPSEAWAAALEAAKGTADFALLIDGSAPLFDFNRRKLREENDGYALLVDGNGRRELRLRVVRCDQAWTVAGIGPSLHAHRLGAVIATLPGSWLEYPPGAYSPDDLEEACALLRREAESDPGDPVPRLRLAEALEAGGDLAGAMSEYEASAAAAGEPGMAWRARLGAGRCRRMSGEAWSEVEAALLELHELEPERAEPLLELGFHYSGAEDHETASRFFESAAACPTPEAVEGADVLASQRALEQLAVSAYYAERYAVGLRAGLEALRAPVTCLSREQIAANLGFYFDKVEVVDRQPIEEAGSTRNA